MALGAVVVGAVVIVWTGLAFQQKVLEQRYLWKLESSEEGDKELAAEKLGQMRSRRAIPQLVEILRRASTQPGAVRSVTFSPDGGRIFVALRDGLTEMRIPSHVRSHYSYRALVRIGRPAVPALLRLLEDKAVWNRLAAAAALTEIDPQEYDEVPFFRETLEVDSVTR